MKDFVPEVVYGVLTFCVTFFITWGAQKAKTEQQEQRLSELSIKLDQAYDKFVTLQQFHSTIDSIKDDQHEIKQDLKQILELLLRVNHA